MLSTSLSKFYSICIAVAFAVLFQTPIGSQNQAFSNSDSDASRLADEVRSKGWIAFCARSEKGDWDLFLCRPDGSERRNITNTPDLNEAAPQFSRDGRRLLYRRMKRDQKIDGNAYGTQGALIISNSDGSKPQIMGEKNEYPWASWSPDDRQIACLTLKGILFYDIETKALMRRLERKGFFQQLTWSPDGSRLIGVANNLGTGWSVACMDAETGAVTPVSRVDCCTPDWFPNSRNVIFSNRPPGQKGNNGYGWTQLWRADAEGKVRRLVYGEDGRHVYGGCVSPDGNYVLFTGNMNEDGDPENQGAAMGLMRLADAPIIGGESPELRSLHPNAHRNPVLELPIGWEPSWTYTEIFSREDSSAEADSEAALAREIRDLGWIAFSSQTEQGDWDLFFMRPDGSERRNITNTPEYNEAGVRFSPDGGKMLYYRMSKSTPLDNNTYGNQILVIANADGGNAEIFGEAQHWAAWSADSRQIAYLDAKGIHIANLKDKQVIRTMPRKGIVQQLGWSPDEKWFCGTANGFGEFWAIGRINALTGEINAVSETDRYNCTPDWFADSEHIVYSRGIKPKEGGWAELWMAKGDGSGKRLLFAEDRRHIYGGALSPDDRCVLFTRSEEDLGAVDNSRTRIAIIRLSDAPMIVGKNESLRSQYPNAAHGPVLDLGWGWEPVWTDRKNTKK